MYKKGRGSFYKHLDVFLADLLMAQLALLVAFVLRDPIPGTAYFLYFDEDWRTLAILLLIIEAVVSLSLRNLVGFMRRGHLREAACTGQLVGITWVILVVILMLTKTTALYSRIVQTLLPIFMLVFIYAERCIMKAFIIWRLPKRREKLRMVLFVGEEEKLRHVIGVAAADKKRDFSISGVILTDIDRTGEEIEAGDIKIPVVGYREVSQELVIAGKADEVFLYLEQDRRLRNKITNSCLDFGIVVHRVLSDAGISVGRSYIEDFAGEHVITSSIAMATPRKLFVKRCTDIAGSLVGLVITGILFLIFAPIIKIKDPAGPILFKQVRVGRNGRRFYLYKFRSMYSDAEQRKAELMKDNEMQGLMFKLTDDPRVLGRFGNFIRHWSLDEFPQFINVLRGDMSLVGTRPPTEDEVERYEGRYMKRLAMKPGITGLWQVSGRSEITDFEEIVKLDVSYIRNWSLKNDIKILCKTFLVVFARKGAK